MAVIGTKITFLEAKKEVEGILDKRSSECAKIDTRLKGLKADPRFKVFRKVIGMIMYFLFSLLFGAYPLVALYNLFSSQGIIGPSGLVLPEAIQSGLDKLAELLILDMNNATINSALTAAKRMFKIDVGGILGIIVVVMLFALQCFAFLSFIQCLLYIIKGSKLNGIQSSIHSVDNIFQDVKTKFDDTYNRFCEKPSSITTYKDPVISVEQRIKNIEKKLNFFSPESRSGKLFNVLFVIFAAVFCLNFTAFEIAFFMVEYADESVPLAVSLISIGLAVVVALFTYIWRFVKLLAYYETVTLKVFIRLCLSALIMFLISLHQLVVPALVLYNWNSGHPVGAILLGAALTAAAYGIWRLCNIGVRRHAARRTSGRGFRSERRW